MKYLKILFNGLIKENPTFVLLLGMCPTLGTTSSALTGMSIGLATTAVLICSNFLISLIKNLVPDMVRIPSFVVVIASLVTVLQMLIQAYAPAVNESLGLFIPLIVVNCIILGRAEAFADLAEGVFVAAEQQLRGRGRDAGLFEKLAEVDLVRAADDRLGIVDHGDVVHRGTLREAESVVVERCGGADEQRVELHQPRGFLLGDQLRVDVHFPGHFEEFVEGVLVAGREFFVRVVEDALAAALDDLAKTHQVIVVTHLVQVAERGERHTFLLKQSSALAKSSCPLSESWRSERACTDSIWLRAWLFIVTRRIGQG